MLGQMIGAGVVAMVHLPGGAGMVTLTRGGALTLRNSDGAIGWSHRVDRGVALATVVRSDGSVSLVICTSTRLLVASAVQPTRLEVTSTHADAELMASYGNTIYVVGSTSKTRVWRHNVELGETTEFLTLHSRPIKHIAIVSGRVVTVGADGIGLWTARGEPSTIVESPRSSKVTSIAVAKRGQVYSGTKRGEVLALVFKAGTVIVGGEYTSHRTPVKKLKVLGEDLISVGSGDEVLVHRILTFQCVRRLKTTTSIGKHLWGKGNMSAEIVQEKDRLILKVIAESGAHSVDFDLTNIASPTPALEQLCVLALRDMNVPIPACVGGKFARSSKLQALHLLPQGPLMHSYVACTDATAGKSLQ